MNTPFGKIPIAIVETVGRRFQVPGSDGMAEINGQDIMVPEQESTLELADLGILQPKIGCERDNDVFFNAHTATLFFH